MKLYNAPRAGAWSGSRSAGGRVACGPSLAAARPVSRNYTARAAQAEVEEQASVEEDLVATSSVEEEGSAASSKVRDGQKRARRRFLRAPPPPPLRAAALAALPHSAPRHPSLPSAPPTTPSPEPPPPPRTTKRNQAEERALSREEIRREVARRRNFAIISHPDAGKTTLTEKLLLFGGAIHEAGEVKARGQRRSATSDWMELEKVRCLVVCGLVCLACVCVFMCALPGIL